MNKPTPSNASRPPQGKTEARAHKRTRTRTLIKGKRVDTESASGFLGMTINLTQAGALIRTYQSMDVGCAIELLIRLPEGDTTVCAHVKHVSQDAVGCWQIGVQFQELNSEAEQMIKRHTEAVRRRGREAAPDTGTADTSSTREEVPVEGRLVR